METSKQKILQNQRFRKLTQLTPSAVICFPLISIIRIYQLFLSPLLGPHCRFEPSCSAYGIEAIRQHGLLGIIMTVNRVRKCHPWHEGGYDPVPTKSKDNLR